MKGAGLRPPPPCPPCVLKAIALSGDTGQQIYFSPQSNLRPPVNHMAHTLATGLRLHVLICKNRNPVSQASATQLWAKQEVSSFIARARTLVLYFQPLIPPPKVVWGAISGLSSPVFPFQARVKHCHICHIPAHSPSVAPYCLWNKLCSLV